MIQTQSTTKNDVDLIPSRLGPVTRFFPGPLQLEFDLDGERVRNIKVQRGFSFRGIDKKLQMHSWKSAIPYVDRIDSDAAFFYETLFCETLEDILKLEVPVRAQWIRAIICELNRVTCHLFTLSQISSSVGAEAGFHFLTRDREGGLDLFELLCGARYHFNYVTVGGVIEDVSDGWLERLDAYCSEILERLEEIHSLLTRNPVFRDRLSDRGILTLDEATGYGIRGVISRSAGSSKDLRLDSPSSPFIQVPLAKLKVVPPVSQQSDVLARWETLAAETEQSVEWMKRAIHSLPAGDFVNSKSKSIKLPNAGEAFCRIESPRGVLTSYFVSDGTESLNRAHFSGPSQFLISSIPTALDGNEMRDVPLVLYSLGYRISEADR